LETQGQKGYGAQFFQRGPQVWCDETKHTQKVQSGNTTYQKIIYAISFEGISLTNKHTTELILKDPFPFCSYLLSEKDNQ